MTEKEDSQMHVPRLSSRTLAVRVRRGCRQRRTLPMELAAIPVLDGSRNTRGSPSAISAKLSGLILPCLMPERPFVQELARDRLTGLGTAKSVGGKLMEDVQVASRETAQPRGSQASRHMGERGDVTRTAPRMWLWIVAILVSLPIGGYIADAVVNGVDSLGAALAGGLIVGAVIGAAEWFALREGVSWLWIPATIVG